VRLTRLESLIVPLAKLSDVHFVDEGEALPASSTQLIGKLEVHVPMAGLIDVEAEVARLEKQLKKLDGEIKGLSGKLNNPGFTDKAPAEVVERERGRLQDAQAQFAKITVTISELKQG
jgi:valyl-tRNA synthetase